MHLLILGASARAAAYSARRAGLHSYAIDLFADADLTAVCPARQVPPDQYPRGMAALAADAPPGPWLYTGAIENDPDLVDRIAAQRPLWGNSGTVLRAIRDPFAWTAALRRAGLPCPKARASPAGLPRDGTWLTKPLASAGGRGIVPFGPASTGPAEKAFYQERIQGLSLSAIFIGSSDRTELAGVTRQVLGRPPAEFAYVGSVGPWPTTAAETTRIADLGVCLARSFGLMGLFGVDFILSEGIPWPVEINPRYTASVEVLELALGIPLLKAHRACFEPERDAISHPIHPRPNTAVGKLILFAPGRCAFPDTKRPRPATGDLFAIPSLGDRPQPGTRFEPGEPVATLFEQADRPENCLAQLERRRARWEKHLMTAADSRSSSRGP